MDWRYFDPETDQGAAQAIWNEVGWIDASRETTQEGLEQFSRCGPGYAGLVHGEPECVVFTAPGRMRYLSEDIDLVAVTGVTTSHLARKQGLAMGLTARAVVEAAANGAALAGLSTFEQGFYNRLGFANAAYEHRWRFDPSQLTVPGKVRPPKRLSVADGPAMHAGRLARKLHHGSVSMLPEAITTAQVRFIEKGFGLGYADGPDESLSHFLWCSTENMLSGPYQVEWMVWQTKEQLLELLGLMRQWGDQVRLVILDEPAGVQLQDFMGRPTYHGEITEATRFASGNKAYSYFQYRILDLAACVEKTRVNGPEVAFNLELSDPLSERPAEGVPWKGLAGTYRVSFGKQSGVDPGADNALPTLKASVGAFTRLWLGVRPATGLSVTDELRGSPELLEALDGCLCLPVPLTDWQF
jgi:hypothetical protein